jgi:hypothetical protein
MYAFIERQEKVHGVRRLCTVMDVPSLQIFSLGVMPKLGQLDRLNCIYTHFRFLYKIETNSKSDPCATLHPYQRNTEPESIGW